MLYSTELLSNILINVLIQLWLRLNCIEFDLMTLNLSFNRDYAQRLCSRHGIPLNNLLRGTATGRVTLLHARWCVSHFLTNRLVLSSTRLLRWKLILARLIAYSSRPHTYIRIIRRPNAHVAVNSQHLFRPIYYHFKSF